MARAIYSEETKAAVMAALLAGQSASEVAQRYKINPSTIRGWKREAQLSNNVGHKKQERIGDLIIDNLEAALETTRAMLNGVFSDREWLEKQEASALAVLYGVISDKTFRVLEALPDHSASGDDWDA